MGSESQIISSGKVIAKNTIMLYFRMIITIVISLYTSRVNLRVLGIVDNGIYQVVGGVVAMFIFLNSSLAGATSRFMTYAIGRGDEQKLKDTFAAALNVHILVAVIVFILSETVGLWFLNNKLVIPEDRMFAARVVYQLSIFSTLISITQVPYNASIISHERMGVFAYMSILDVSLKLLICYLLYLSPFDKLISYAVMMLAVTVGMQIIYRTYCIRHFSECHFQRKTDKSILKPILSFSGWDLFGNFSVMARNQGLSMVMNMFFGPVVNAAVGFSHTIGTTILGFSNNFLTAIRPPIVKAYSIGDIPKMESLMINASRFSFSLLLLLSTPFFFESSYLLELWLKTPPPHTDIFCKLELGLSVLSSMFLPLVYAIHASGKIRFMSLVNGSIWILVVPVTWIFLKKGFPPSIPYIIKIFLLFFVVCSNLYSTKKNIPSFQIKLYLRKAVLPSFITLVITIGVTLFFFSMMGERGIWRLLGTCSVSTCIILVCVYYIVFDKELRERVNRKILNIIRRK